MITKIQLTVYIHEKRDLDQVRTQLTEVYKTLTNIAGSTEAEICEDLTVLETQEAYRLDQLSEGSKEKLFEEFQEKLKADADYNKYVDDLAKQDEAIKSLGNDEIPF